MLKLLKNEWKRYRLFSFIMLIVTAGIGALLSLSVFFYSFMDMEDELVGSMAGIGSIVIIALVVIVMPFAAGIYCLLSYTSDIGRKGMIFLTPVPTWKIVLSKLIFTAGMFIVLYIVSLCSLMIAAFISDVNFVSDIGEILVGFATFKYVDLAETDNEILIILGRFIMYLLSTLIFSVTTMGCISLARFAANSVGVQVLLSILFYWIISMIESTINTLVHILFMQESYFMYALRPSADIASWDFFAGIIYAVVMYIICVCLTDRKVNLVS